MECNKVCELIDEHCHKCSDSHVSKHLKLVREFGDYDQDMLMTNNILKNIRKYHEIKYLSKYHPIFGKTCSDPLKIHKEIRENIPDRSYFYKIWKLL